MDDIYANVDKSVNPRPSTNQTGSERRFRGAVLCLGLLNVFLLAGLIGLGVHYHVTLRGSAAELSTIKVNLTERLQASENKLSSVSVELDRLQRWSKQNKTCPAGWRMFSSSCYLLSNLSGSWEKGRQYCRERGADLLVIESFEEQTFLSEFIKKGTWYWIGLSDRDEEGTWKWVDGTPLTLKNWNREQPDNGGGDPQYGEEDCVQVGPITTGWNDRSCEDDMYWICKKKA